MRERRVLPARLLLCLLPGKFSYSQLLSLHNCDQKPRPVVQLTWWVLPLQKTYVLVHYVAKNITQCWHSAGVRNCLVIILSLTEDEVMWYFAGMISWKEWSHFPNKVENLWYSVLSQPYNISSSICCAVKNKAAKVLVTCLSNRLD